jgi:hypothetical protein
VRHEGGGGGVVATIICPPPPPPPPPPPHCYDLVLTLYLKPGGTWNDGGPEGCGSAAVSGLTRGGGGKVRGTT